MTNIAWALLRMGRDLVGSTLTPPDGIVGAYSVPEEGEAGGPCHNARRENGAVAGPDVDALVGTGHAALEAGDWSAAREAFAEALRESETAGASFGLAAALWWLGESQASVDASTRAYALFRRAGDVEGAVRSATWLCVTYKSNFGNHAAANGWIERADRLLRPIDIGPLHGWAAVARAYQMADLEAAASLTENALAIARRCDEIDLELVALSQLGRIRVGMGHSAPGFAMIDEAMAAALGGERSSLDTVVYTCCDMLNACEVATDLERAAQWCQVADGFIEQYGCPFLYAECRTLYGGVLVASGRWADADRELAAALHMTAGACPALHSKALIRLAGLRIRQGRLEEAHDLLLDLDQHVAADAEAALARAALLLARGDAIGAGRVLAAGGDDLSRTRATAAIAYELLVDAHLSVAELDAATAAVERLAKLATALGDDRSRATAAAARGATRVRRRRCRCGSRKFRGRTPHVVIARSAVRDGTMRARAQPGDGATRPDCRRGTRTARIGLVRPARREHRLRPCIGVSALTRDHCPSRSEARRRADGT
jgi:tetratricopeptide (TPR) repeat protein